MQVDVSGHQFVFPTLCACCNGSADTELTVSTSKSTGVRVIRTSTNEWAIPYCQQCVAHVKLAVKATEAAEAAKMLGLVLGGVSVVVAGICWYFMSPFLGIPIGIAGLVVTALLYAKFHTRCAELMKKAQAMCGPRCVCVDEAVRYLDWHGPLHMFWIGSQEYALAFMVANHKKLVNISPQASRLLAANGHLPSVGAPRAPRRNRS